VPSRTEPVHPVGLLFKIKHRETTGGLTCEEVIANFVLDNYRESIRGSGSVSSLCEYDTGFCVTSVKTKEVETVPQYPPLPHCDILNADLVQCPPYMDDLQAIAGVVFNEN